VVNIGTSTVNILVEDAPKLLGKDLTSVCGQAENSVLPGLIGIETSQAAFGDVFAWFQDLLMWPFKKLLKDVTDLNNEKQKQIIDEIKGRLLVVLENETAQLPIKDGVVALDWFNGRRYPDPNETIKSAMAGLSLGTGAGEIYQGLVMATAFGQKCIFDRLLEAGIQIDEIIAVGGIAKKSPFVLQTLADVLGRPIKVSQAEYASARGAAIYAAVGAGVYASIPAAQEHLCLGFDKMYYPDSDQKMALSDAYQQYLRLGKWMEEEC
jgi:L-ribulokinase